MPGYMMCSFLRRIQLSTKYNRGTVITHDGRRLLLFDREWDRLYKNWSYLVCEAI